jgi:hypothetical protein
MRRSMSSSKFTDQRNSHAITVNTP